jgi:cell division protein FtsB
MAYTHGYIDGSTARNLQQDAYIGRVSERTRRNRERVNSVRRSDVLVFGVEMICLVLACIFFLSMHSNVTQYQKSVQRKEKELHSLVDANNATEERLNSSLDVDAIYKRATKDLGMVYAADDQVVYYKSTNPDYVVQYDNVPSRD